MFIPEGWEGAAVRVAVAKARVAATGGAACKAECRRGRKLNNQSAHEANPTGMTKLSTSTCALMQKL